MSVNSKMTALADEIRELSGTTTTKSIDTMTSDVNTANVEIAEQAELLEQIATALEGKTGSGCTEDLNTELTTQENLISQLSMILDNKASGGSGGGVEYEIVNLTEESTSIPFTLKRVTSTFGMMTTSGQGGLSAKNAAHYNLKGMSGSYQGAVVSFLRTLYFENSALTSGTSFIVPYVAVFINDPAAEALYEE
jgi:hypothetical protein